MFDNFRGIFEYLPIPAQDFLIDFEGRKRHRLRFGGDFEKKYMGYKARSFWTPGQVMDFQKNRLIEFLTAVFRCPPDEALLRFGKHGMMTKREAMEYFHKELLAEYSAIKTHTSGTTGTGLIFYTTRNSQQEQWAVWWRYRDWHGIPRDEWSCFFGAPKIVPLRQRTPPFWRENHAGKQLIFSNYHLDKANASHYLGKIKETGYRWIHGFPSSISLLAAYACDLGIRVPVKWVTLSAENLLSHQVKLIENAFGVKPIQHYGQEEGVANISQCPSGKLHVDEDYSCVEFIPSDYGEDIYHITGTNFTNPVFPLIRYDTGDLATVLPGDSCDCGRPGRVVNSLDGRLSDYVLTKSGKPIGLLDHVFKDCVNVQKIQVHQDKPGFITILIIKGDAYGSADEAKLTDQIHHVLGKEMDYEIQYVQDIPRTGGGKHRLVVSSLKGDILPSVSEGGDGPRNPVFQGRSQDPGPQAPPSDLLAETSAPITWRVLYNHLPFPLQNLMVNFEGRKRVRQRFGKGFEEIYQAYMDRSFWTSSRILEFQNSRLRAFLSIVFRCPPDKTMEVFQRHSIMNKKDAYRYYRQDYMSGSHKLKHHTSGTTGEGLFFYHTQKSEREQWAVWWRHRSWHGIPRDEWSCYFGGQRIVPLSQRRPPFWRENRAGKQIIFSNYHLDRVNARLYLKALQESGHRWIHGYPSSISLLAAYACDLGIQVPMKWVTTSAENLLPYQLSSIEKAFGVKPIQHYGLAEGVANISECPEGKLHVDEDFSFVEFLPTNYGPDVYHIIGTNFTNPVFPLVRYDTEDLATLKKGDFCHCGRPGRIVQSLDGRQSDYVVTKTGKFIGLLDHLFTDCSNILKAQVRQEKPGIMTILVVRGGAYSPKDEAKLRSQTYDVLGDEVDCDIEYVQDIPSTQNGKHRLVVSTINQAIV